MKTLPVVLVPGMLCDADLWTEIRSGLDAHTVIPSIDATTIGAMAEQVLASAEGPFVLTGLSLGAIVGFEVLRIAPERVTGFCALSTNAGAPTIIQHRTWNRMAAQCTSGDFEQIVRDILPTMFADETPLPSLADRFTAMAARVGPVVLQRQLAAQCTRVDALPELRNVTCPTLVVSATRDHLCPDYFHRDIADAVPRSRLEHLHGAGHLSPWEQPAEIARMINSWLPATSESITQE
ncbi:alpha/beta fold hydrolase [Rhodococcus sp. NPDC057135]|uniref:alpha/beta fold hydrolase n=1 Tax=Rhodococcus sp. NPDC057135 TaxID=3346028 RepID=UPI00363E57D4